MNEKLTKLETEVEKKIRNEKNCQKSGNGRKRKKKFCPQLNYKVHGRGLTQVII